MNRQPNQATKEKSHEYMQERIKNKQPLPSQEEIRRRLGWNLIHANKPKSAF